MPVTVPTQDMILGTYYLTFVRNDEPGAGKIFSSVDEAMLAYDTMVDYEEGETKLVDTDNCRRVVGLHAPIKVWVETVMAPRVEYL